MKLLAAALLIFFAHLDLNAQELEAPKSFADETTQQTEVREFDTKSERVQLIPYYADPAQGTPTLKKKTRKGEKIYATKQSPQKYFSGVRTGPFYPGSLRGNIDGITYQNVYGSAPRFLTHFDIEWQFVKNFGKLGLQTGIGLLPATGFGRFTTRTNVAAEEAFTLIVIPVHLTAVYRFHFWDKQPLIPFAGIGAAYYGMSEIREDKTSLGEKLKFAGGAAWQWLAGAQFMLDSLDREVLWQLDQDYGINHVYLTANIRQIFGISRIYDFSALYYEGGVAFEF